MIEFYENDPSLTAKAIRQESDRFKQDLVSVYDIYETAGYFNDIQEGQVIYSAMRSNSNALRPKTIEQVKYVNRIHEDQWGNSGAYVNGLNLTRNTDDAFDIFVGYVGYENIMILGMFDWGDIIGGTDIDNKLHNRTYSVNVLKKAKKLLIKAAENIANTD